MFLYTFYSFSKNFTFFLKIYLNIVKFNNIIRPTKDEGVFKNGIGKKYIF